MRWPTALTMVGAVIASTMMSASPAWADAAGPTNYRSEVTAIDPPGRVTATVVGGDSFLELRVEAGVDVIVLGYWNEPFLHIDRTGHVFENTRSPTPPQNTARYGVASTTPDADPDPATPPVWRQISGSGQAMWHDHRIHWMSPTPAPINGPQRIVNEWTIKLIVNGTPTTIRGVLYREQGPSPAWWTLGIIVFASGMMLDSRRRTLVIAAMGAAVLVAALVERSSLHGAARPTPVTALQAALVIVMAGAGWRSWKRWWTPPLTLGAAGLLALVGWLQRHHVDRLIIPGSFPTSLWRVFISVAVGIGAAGIIGSARELFWSAARPSGHAAVASSDTIGPTLTQEP